MIIRSFKNVEVDWYSFSNKLMYFRNFISNYDDLVKLNKQAYHRQSKIGQKKTAMI